MPVKGHSRRLGAGRRMSATGFAGNGTFYLAFTSVSAKLPPSILFQCDRAMAYWYALERIFGGVRLHTELPLRRRAIQEDPYLLERDQSALHHAVNDIEQAANLLFAVDDLDHQG